MPLDDAEESPFWQRFDAAYWRGVLLYGRLGLAGSGLSSDEVAVACLVFDAEEGNLDPHDPIYAQLVERLGQGAPPALSARAALGYAHATFLGGDWQTCLDALHQAALTTVLSPEGGIRPEGAHLTLRRLRAEACLRLADFWALFRQPGLVLRYLAASWLASNRPPMPSIRFLARLRWLCRRLGDAPAAALLTLAANGSWGTVFRRLVDQDWGDLPRLEWPPPPAPETVAAREGCRAAFELCVSEALSTSGNTGIGWAQRAVDFALDMQSPAWIAVAELVLAHLAIKQGALALAAKSLAHAMSLIQSYRLEGLRVYAMLANLPLQAEQGAARAALQAREAMPQVRRQVAMLRDLVFRRRALWAHEAVFGQAFHYALQANERTLAWMAMLYGKGLGWRATGTGEPGVDDMFVARTRLTGPATIGEELFEPRSLRTGVYGPHVYDDSWAESFPEAWEYENLIRIDDADARSERLQLVREQVFGVGEQTSIALPDPPERTFEIHFWVVDEAIYRIDRWRGGDRFITVPITNTEVQIGIIASGLSVTAATRDGPVHYAPIDDVTRRLLADLPQAALDAKRVCIWPHGLLHFLPFHYTVQTLLPQDLGVSVMLGIEATGPRLSLVGSPIRLAPTYSGDLTPLPGAAAEVTAARNVGDIVQADVPLPAEAILRFLMQAPSLFHFAGHAINRNDHPELAGLYGSDLALVSVADILNLGRYGPQAAILSACETGPGPLHSADGSYSLARAFLQTGSAWVVASLWKVEDTATGRLMHQFLHNLRRRLAPEDALPIGPHPFVLYRPMATEGQGRV